MPESYFQYQGNKVAAGTNVWSLARSESIWWDCPWDRLRNGEVSGIARHWDFSSFKTSSNVNAAQAYWENGLRCFGDNGAAITALDAVGGGVSIGSDGDNEGLSFDEVDPCFELGRADSDFWFEAMVKTSTITDTKHNIFLGLTDNTAKTATVPITAAGALADLNLVGFRRTEAALGGALLDTVYKADGVTAVTIKAGAVTLVADTYVKLGMRYRATTPDKDVQGSTSNAKYLLSFYANGVRLVDYKQIPSAAGSDFPNDVRLGFCFAVLNATGTTPGTSSIRWARLAQLL